MLPTWDCRWSQFRRARHLPVWMNVVLFAMTAVAPALAQQKQPVKPTDKPFLWEIEGKTPSYLYGTIHIPADRVLALPSVVEDALAASDAFYAEIPLDLATQMSIAPRMLLPGDKTLKDVLPPKLYERTGRYLQSKGYSIEAFSKFKVWVLAAQLALLDYVREFATKPAPDLALWTRASTAGKELGGIETADEQLGVFESFSEKEQVALLSRTLDLLEEALKKGEDVVQKLLNAYLGGDEDKLSKVMNEYLDLENALDRKIYEKLFTERDRRMAKRIAKTIKADPDKSNFFAIGAGHLVDKEGVVALLKKNGMRLRRLTPQDAVKVKAP